MRHTAERVGPAVPRDQGHRRCAHGRRSSSRSRSGNLEALVGRRLRCGAQGYGKRALLSLLETGRIRLSLDGGALRHRAEFITEPDGLEIVPVPMGEDVSSLSAILLDADYYSFMCGGRKVVDGISVLGEAYLVPFKAKAFLDLRERRACGEHVDSKDLRKHKNDVFRLLQLFTPETTAPLPDSIRDDMSHFCNIMSEEGVPLRQIGVRMTLDEALGQIARSYGL